MYKFSERYYNKYTLQVVARISCMESGSNSYVFSSPKRSKKHLAQSLHHASVENLSAYTQVLNASTSKIISEEKLTGNKAKKEKQLKKKVRSPAKIASKNQQGTLPQRTSKLGQSQQKKQDPPKIESYEMQKQSEENKSPIKKKPTMRVTDPNEVQIYQYKLFKQKFEAAKDQVDYKMRQYKKKDQDKIDAKIQVCRFKKQILIDKIIGIKQKMACEANQIRRQQKELQESIGKLDKMKDRAQIQNLCNQRMKLNAVREFIEERQSQILSKEIKKIEAIHNIQMDQLYKEKYELDQRYYYQYESRIKRARSFIREQIQKDL